MGRLVVLDSSRERSKTQNGCVPMNSKRWVHMVESTSGDEQHSAHGSANGLCEATQPCDCASSGTHIGGAWRVPQRQRESTWQSTLPQGAHIEVCICEGWTARSNRTGQEVRAALGLTARGGRGQHAGPLAARQHTLLLLGAARARSSTAQQQ